MQTYSQSDNLSMLSYYLKVSVSVGRAVIKILMALIYDGVYDYERYFFLISSALFLQQFVN